MREVLAAGAGRDVLSYRTLKVLAALDPAVAEVTGFTRYRIEGDTADDASSIVDRGGIGRDMPVAGSSATPCCWAPSAGWPPSARCSSPAAAATAAR